MFKLTILTLQKTLEICSELTVKDIKTSTSDYIILLPLALNNIAF